MRAGFAERPRAPVLVLTGQSDYEIDLEATALGVTDYLVKQEQSAASLERSIRYAVTCHQATRDLALSEERYALAVGAASDGIWDWDLRAGRIYFSPRWREILGQPERADEDDPASWFTSCTRRICTGCARRSRPTSAGAPRASSPSTGCVTPAAAGGGC